VYGDDRFFVYIAARGDEADPQLAQLDALEAAGHPVMRLAAIDPHDLGALFFRWEIATAVAGGILGIDPFDQPDVEASKIATRRLLASNGPAAAGEPLAQGSGLQLYADAANSARSAAAASRRCSRSTSRARARATTSRSTRTS